MACIFLFLFLVSFTKSENYPNKTSIQNKVVFLKKFLECLQKPVQIYGYFCWRKDQIKYLQKELSYGFLQSSFFTNLGDFNDTTRKTAITFVIDLTCNCDKRMLIKANENQLFHKAHTWIFFGNSFDELREQNYTFYSKTFFIEYVDRHFKVTKIYKSSGLSKHFAEMEPGSCCTSKMAFLRSPSTTNINFNGDPIRVSYALIYNESILHLTDYRQTDKDIIPKMIYLLMSNVAYFLNATHVPIFRSFWGNLDSKTGLYTPGGMFADLQQGKSDVAGNSALITHERLEDFRFLAADTTPDMISWFFRAPRLMSTKNIWILPFDRITWCAVCAFSILGAIIFSAIATIENQYYLNRCNMTQKHRLIDIIIDITTAFCTQRGTSTEFVSFSGKLAYIAFAVLILNVYTAFCAQFDVLLQWPNNKISTFDELLKSKMDIGAEDTVYNRFYFTQRNDLVDESLRQKIYTRKIKGQESVFFLNETTGMEKVRQGYFAFHILNPTAYRIIKETYNEYERRTVRTLKPIIGVTKVFLCVPKNSSMEDFISIGLLRLHETGIKNMEFLRLFPPKPTPDYLSTGLFVSLGLREIYHLYLGLGCGILASVIILLLECICYNSGNKRKHLSNNNVKK